MMNSGNVAKVGSNGIGDAPQEEVVVVCAVEEKATVVQIWGGMKGRG